MKTRLAIVICSSQLLTACYPFVGGEADYTVLMQRSADGAKTFCSSGIFISGGFIDGKADAIRTTNACVIACRKHGFVEVDTPVAVDEKRDVLEPEEGWANTPEVCQD